MYGRDTSMRFASSVWGGKGSHLITTTMYLSTGKSGFFHFFLIVGNSGSAPKPAFADAEAVSEVTLRVYATDFQA